MKNQMQTIRPLSDSLGNNSRPLIGRTEVYMRL